MWFNLFLYFSSKFSFSGELSGIFILFYLTVKLFSGLFEVAWNLFTLQKLPQVTSTQKVKEVHVF